MNELLLWRSFKEGNTKALSKIFLAHFDALVRYGLKLMKDEEPVKDCIQDLFFRLWNNRRNLKDVGVIRPYLLKSFRRHIYDRWTADDRQSRFIRHFALEPDIEFSCEDFIISREISRKQHELLTVALNKLTRRQKEAVYLKFYENLSYEKIADVMSLNTQSVRNLIYQALTSLRSELPAYGLSALYCFLKISF